MASNRNRAWADQRFNIGALIAGATQTRDLLSGTPIPSDNITAIRLIVDLWAMYEPSATLVDSLSIVSFGVGVASVEAFTVGGTSLPNPDAVGEFPPRGWLYVDSQPVHQRAESTGVIESMAHFKVDLGAMRKVDKGILFASIRQENIVVGGAMRVVGRVRTLCLT